MRARSLEDVAAMLGGSLRGKRGKAPIGLASGASIDTRRLTRGDLFFALGGVNTHGRRFAREALERGAAAVVTDEDLSLGGPRIVVDDVAGALGRLADGIRAEERSRLPCAVVTGSLGKTTSCRYAGELLRAVGVPHRPEGSFNNHLGVPLTILGAPGNCQYLIVEVGANRPGEVLPLARWARPDVACVTSISSVHLEGFGDLEGVAREKLSILEALSDAGEGWIPVEVARDFGALLGRAGARLRTFGRGGDLEISAGSADGGRESTRFRLRFGHEEPPMSFDWVPPHRHSVRHLEAALAIAAGLGVPPEALLDRIGELTLPPLRGEVHEHGGVQLVLDCYNSSPEALESSIAQLESDATSGRRICVVGTMEELGEAEERFHRQLGEVMADSSVDSVFLLGRGREWFQAGLNDRGRDGEYLANDVPSAERLVDALEPGDRVLFKASRTEALETFAARVARLLDEKYGVATASAEAHERDGS